MIFLNNNQNKKLKVLKQWRTNLKNKINFKMLIIQNSKLNKKKKQINKEKNQKIDHYKQIFLKNKRKINNKL